MHYIFTDASWEIRDNSQGGLEVGAIVVTKNGEFTVSFRGYYGIYQEVGILKPGNFPTLALAKEYLEKLPEISELDHIIRKLIDIVKQSDGVTGYHKNGEIATWGEFFNIDSVYSL